MGTRHLIKVVNNGDLVVAQYGQWDGYPGSAAEEIFSALQLDGALEKLRTNITKCEFWENVEIESVIQSAGVEWSKKYPTLSRDMGYKIVRHIIEHETDSVIPLSDQSEFEDDHLFCEYVYEVNLDTNRFTGYIPSKPKKLLVDLDLNEVSNKTVELTYETINY